MSFSRTLELGAARAKVAATRSWRKDGRKREFLFLEFLQVIACKRQLETPSGLAGTEDSRYFSSFYVDLLLLSRDWD